MTIFDDSDGFFTIVDVPPSKRKPKPSDGELESAIQRKAIKALRKRGVFVSRANAFQIEYEGRHINGAEAGHSDLCGCLPPTGRAWYIEMKRPGNKPTPLQAKFIAARRAEGAIADWADSVERVLRILGFEPTRWEREQ